MKILHKFENKLFKTDKQSEKRKSTKQAIEIIKKTEKNPQDCYITDKKCANKNIWRIKAQGRPKKTENKMENFENSEDEIQHCLYS